MNYLKIGHTSGRCSGVFMILLMIPVTYIHSSMVVLIGLIFFTTTARKPRSSKNSPFECSKYYKPRLVSPLPPFIISWTTLYATSACQVVTSKKYRHINGQCTLHAWYYSFSLRLRHSLYIEFCPTTYSDGVPLANDCLFKPCQLCTLSGAFRHTVG